MRVLKIRKQFLHAAQYIPFDEKCGNLHGHTYFLRNMKLGIENRKFVNFKIIKTIVDQYDHVMLIPPQHRQFWFDINDMAQKKCLGVTIKTVVVDGCNKMNLVEELGEQLSLDLLAIPEVWIVYFEISEGPNQGVVVTQIKDNVPITKEMVQYVASV